MGNADAIAALRRACDTPLPIQPGHWNFKCSSCLETIDDQAMLVLHNDRICVSCFDIGIKPQFIAALADESQFPVKWGGKEVVLQQYRYCFSQSFRDAWKAKLDEYNVSPAKRLYCQGKVNARAEISEICNTFLGRKKLQESIEHCETCGWDSCAVCASSFAADGPVHVCSGPSEDAEADPFADLKRGVDYQRCPGCDMAVELRDGCNHITCRLGRCGQHFCFLCGRPATREDGHWSAGRPCPLYHQPNAANAQYDARVPDAAETAAIAGIIAEADQDLLLGRRLDTDVNVPEQVRQRRAHRVELDAMLTIVEGEIVQWLQRRDESAVIRLAYIQPLLSMHYYLQTLYKSLFAYTIELEADENSKEVLTLILDRLGPQIIALKDAASIEMRARFPRADEIFVQIAAAATRLIPARPEAEAAVAG